MAELSQPKPFDEAFAWARDRVALPTTLGHDQLQALRRQIGRKGLLLARVADARILSAVQDRIGQLARGVQERPGEYMDPGKFRVEMQSILNSVDYKPEPGREGTISDLRSKARLDLIVQTETELAAGRAQQAADLDPDVTDMFPAWELYRAKKGKTSRDWEERWRIAANASGDATALAALDDHSRMVARKDSPIWAELGSSDNFDDALDTDHAPFAFNSGMALRNINRATAVNLGIIQRGQRLAPTQSQQPEPLEQSVASISPQIRAALLGVMPGATINEAGTLSVDGGGAA